MVGVVHTAKPGGAGSAIVIAPVGVQSLQTMVSLGPPPPQADSAASDKADSSPKGKAEQRVINIIIPRRNNAQR